MIDPALFAGSEQKRVWDCDRWKLALYGKKSWLYLDETSIDYTGPRRSLDAYISWDEPEYVPLLKALSAIVEPDYRHYFHFYQTYPVKQYPREAIGAMLSTALPKLSRVPGVKAAYVFGSYARGAPLVGDVDVYVETSSYPPPRRAVRHCFPGTFPLDILFEVPTRAKGEARLVWSVGDTNVNAHMERIQSDPLAARAARVELVSRNLILGEEPQIAELIAERDAGLFSIEKRQHPIATFSSHKPNDARLGPILADLGWEGYHPSCSHDIDHKLATVALTSYPYASSLLSDLRKGYRVIWAPKLDRHHESAIYLLTPSNFDPGHVYAEWKAKQEAERDQEVAEATARAENGKPRAGDDWILTRRPS